jgi:hypothetical protein
MSSSVRSGALALMPATDVPAKPRWRDWQQKIDGEIKFRWLLNRQIGWLRRAAARPAWQLRFGFVVEAKT